jgi:5-deoxy-D-glucuronate isomerase
VQSVGYPIARRVSNNEDTLNKRQQAAERHTLFSDRKDNSKIQHVLTCNTVTDEQVTTPPHTEQQEGNATAAAVGTSYFHRFQPTTKTIHA